MQRFIISSLFCLLSACGTSPKVDTYILSANSANKLITVSEDFPKVFVKSLSFPDYLDRPQIVIRKDEVTLDIQEFKRWAEPLQSSFLRVFKAEMLQQGIDVSKNKQFRHEYFDYQLSLEIISFEVNSAQKASLVVKWVLLNSENNQLIASNIEKQEVGFLEESFVAKVNAQSQVISLFCAQLAAQVRLKYTQLN